MDRRVRFWARLAWAALVPVVLAAIWEQAQLFSTLAARPWAYAIDYKLYRVAAAIGAAHGWPHIYDASLQRAAIIPFWPRAGWPAWWHSAQPFWTPMVTPPPAAWVAAPFGGLPLSAASALWIALLAVALVATALVAAPPELASRLRYLALPALTLASVIALVSANLVVLVGLALVVGWRLLEDRRDAAAGAVLAVAMLKPQVVFVVPVLLFVAGRGWAVLEWAVAATAVAVISVLTLGPHGIQAYRELLSYVSGFTGQQSLGLGQLPLPAGARAALAAAAFLVFAAVTWRTRARGPATAMALGILASLLLSPYLNSEDFVLLVPAGLLLLRARRNVVEAVLAIALVLTATPATQGYVLPAAAVAALIVVALAAAPRRVARLALRPA